jgi:general secretion pathway protein D
VLTLTPPGVAQDVQPVDPPTLPPAEDPLADDEALVLNFEQADVREVIHSLATALGLSYSIDPRVEGEITIRTTGRIPRQELFPLFNQILRSNGIAAVRSGELYHIVPVEEAKTRAIIPRSGTARTSATASDTFVIEIIANRHVAAEEMANILTPFLTPGGEVFSYPRANTVVVTDLRSNVERLRELATAFDIDGFSNLRARVFKLKEGDPDELVNELTAILAPYTGGVSEGAGGLSMVPLFRLNAIVAFAFDPSAFDEMERWLTLLDIPPEKGSGRQTFVYQVENTKAADLAAVLNELFGGEGGSGGIGGRSAGAAPAGVGLFGAGGVSGRTGSPGRSGQVGQRGVGGRSSARGGASGGAQLAGRSGGARGGRNTGGVTGGAGGVGVAGGAGGGLGGGGGTLGASGGGLGQGGETGGGVLGVSLPGGAAAQAQTQPGEPPGPPPIFKQEVRIVADEVTNSLVVLATRRDYQLILDILRRIDIVPRQVVLEVMIAEVLLGKGLDFGVAYAYANGDLADSVTPPAAGDDDDDDGGVLGSQDLFNTLSNVAGLNPRASRLPLAGAFAVLNDGDSFQVFLSALQTRTNVKVLSAPHVIAADNREASILVGRSIPILTSTSTNVLQGGAGQVNTVQYRDTGKILSVLPQVNSKGLVNLEIRQEVSDVGDAEFGATGSPSFVTREVNTTLIVQNGETVLIGGIIDDRIVHGRSGVPYLMDIPVLGRAFRTERDSVDRTELLITITPFVIRNREEARQVTDDFSARIEGLRELRDAMHTLQGTRREREPAYEVPDHLYGTPMDER